MIVAVTGHTAEGFIRKAWRYQIDEVLGKPTDIEHIRIIMNEVIER